MTSAFRSFMQASLRKLVGIIKPTTMVVTESKVSVMETGRLYPSLLIRKRKPVHKAPQFPCNHFMPIETMKALKSSRNWDKVTCANCLRSQLKKAYNDASIIRTTKEYLDES